MAREKPEVTGGQPEAAGAMMDCVEKNSEKAINSEVQELPGVHTLPPVYSYNLLYRLVVVNSPVSHNSTRRWKPPGDGTASE